MPEQSFTDLETESQGLRSQCLGKLRFASKFEARKHTWSGLLAYRCPHCGNWHNGHKTGSGKSARSEFKGPRKVRAPR